MSDDFLDLAVLAEEHDNTRLLHFVLASLNDLGKRMSTISDALAADKASLDALTAEVANSNVKIDALIALAQAAGVTQADIDAAVALKAEADAATASIQAEEAKVDGVLNPPA